MRGLTMQAEFEELLPGSDVHIQFVVGISCRLTASLSGYLKLSIPVRTRFCGIIGSWA